MMCFYMIMKVYKYRDGIMTDPLSIFNILFCYKDRSAKLYIENLAIMNETVRSELHQNTKNKLESIVFKTILIKTNFNPIWSRSLIRDHVLNIWNLHFYIWSWSWESGLEYITWLFRLNKDPAGIIHGSIEY